MLILWQSGAVLRADRRDLLRLYILASERHRGGGDRSEIALIRWKEISLERWAWFLPVAAFLSLVLVHSDLPGIYMDAVNPDFLAAQWLHHGHNPGAGIPSKVFPILGSFYHGLQNAYLGLPFFALAGFSVTSLRLEQAVFGAILLAALYHLTRRLTGSRWLAIFTSVGLATELAFTASFRTQFYIVLGGAAWLFVSMLLALPAEEDSWIVRRRTFWSGVFFGLAAYGYFVLAFFAPAMAILVAVWTPRRQWAGWVAGALVGVSPFFLGMLSLVAKKHGIGPAIEFVRGMLGQLKPFDASGASGNNLQYAWDMLRLAVSDAANEGMIFGGPLQDAWGNAKAWAIAVSVVVLAGWGMVATARRDGSAALTLPAWMPVSFIAVASLFGHRLWAHHFSVLVPFLYLLPALVFARVMAVAPHASRWGIAAIFMAVLGGNLWQQAKFHEVLAATGGEGKSSDALTRMAMEARGAPANVAYVFPDWGFFTSFCFLTGNQVRYAVDLRPETFAKLKRDGITEVRLVYWDAGSEAGYRQALAVNGLEVVEERSFLSRNGQPVFRWLSARAQKGLSLSR